MPHEMYDTQYANHHTTTPHAGLPARRYLGPLTFMTTQCNLFLLGYFTLSVAAFVLGVGGSVLELHLIKWSPVMFAFGPF